MNRIIKFKAFHNGKMIYRGLHDRNWYTSDNKLVKGVHPLDYHNLKVMQFTGYKDIDGKEIYEGDKVIYTLNHDASQKEIKADVEWHNHAWRLNRIWLLTEIRNITVVGDVS